MNIWENKMKESEKVKAKYPKGTRIELICMNDPWSPVESGMRGTVVWVDAIGNIQVAWDNGRGLALIPGIDAFKIVEEEE